MPAMHLISVDLPAPLSPTIAITSPWRTSKSTSVSAWTEPNDFVTPRSSSRGVVSFIEARKPARRRPRGASARIGLLAVLRVVAVADVALLQEAGREQQ